MPAYRPLFAGPEAPRVVAASIAARLAIGAFVLPLILTVQQATGSFATAGLATGAFSLAVAVAAPARGRIVDRRGARAALPVMAVISAGAVAGIALGAAGAPAWALVVLAAIGGATTPPLVASMRLEWQRLLGRGDPRLAQAYAFESGAQTAVFVVGPLLAGAGLAAFGPRGTLALSAALLVVGTVAFALTAGTIPDPVAADAHSPIRRPGVLTLVVVTALADLALGGVEVIVTAFAEERGRPGLAGLLLALFAASAVAGALIYGLRTWRPSPAVQLVALTIASAAAIAALALPGALSALAVVLLLAGAPSAAGWAACSLALDRASGGSAGAEAFTWLSAANGAGIAAGSVLAGAVVEAAGTATAFLVMAAGPALAAAFVALRRATLAAEPHSA